MARAAGALAEVCRWACRVKLSAGRLTGRPLSVLISPGATRYELYELCVWAVDEQGLPVVQGAVSDPFGTVAGHDGLDRRRLGMPG